MKNHEMREVLTETIQDLRSGKVNVATSREVVNAAGKYLKSLVVDIEYRHLVAKHPDTAKVEDLEPNS